MPCFSISAIFSVMILYSAADTRYGAQLIRRASPVSMACSVMSVDPKLPSAGGKHCQGRTKSWKTASLFAADRFSPTRASFHIFASSECINAQAGLLCRSSWTTMVFSGSTSMLSTNSNNLYGKNWEKKFAYSEQGQIYCFYLNDTTWDNPFTTRLGAKFEIPTFTRH